MGVLLVEVTRNVRATCLPIPWKHKSSNMSAFGIGASVLGGWRFGAADASVFKMQPLYVSWQLLEANLT